MSWSEEKLATSRTSIDGNRIVVNTSDADIPDTDYKREAAEQIAAMSPEEFHALEKKLLWKIDLKLIPWMTYVEPSSLSYAGLTMIHNQTAVLGEFQAII